MTATRTRSPSESRTDGPRLRPRVHDVTDADYGRAAGYVGADDDAYLERRGGRTFLVVR
jgi:hypothetical protein